MSTARGILGAAVGAAVAGVALRIRTVSREREQPISEIITDLPAILAQDAARLSEAARGAASDGRHAAEVARVDFDEQVAARARRTKGNDD